MLDAVLFGLMIFFGAILLVAALTDRLLFYYKKTPGRGYAQIARPNRPQWLISLYSNLELVGFLGFITVCLVMAWQYR
jgi:hypothetical protein